MSNIQQEVIKVVKSNDFIGQLSSGFSLHSSLVQYSQQMGEESTIHDINRELLELIPTTNSVEYEQIGKDGIYTIFPYECYKKRMALAFNLQIGDYLFLVGREEAIHGDDISQEHRVNYGKLDCIIASRVFLPSGENYGLFGKAEKTRALQHLFRKLFAKVEMSEYLAQETNTVDEDCPISIMPCGTLYVEDNSESAPFIKLLEESEMIVKVRADKFVATEENSTAKLIACLKKE